MPISPEVQKMGVQAANKKMSVEEKKERAKAASLARWRKKKGIDYHAPLPEAAYRGKGFLGNEECECYVLTNGERVISSSQAVTFLTGKLESRDLPKILGISGVKSLINKDNLEPETIPFYIPGNPTVATGIRAETFADICHAFVTAALQGELTTEYQRSIAMRCVVYQKVFMKLGIVAYVDELTHYQKFRDKEALDIKVKAYVQEEARRWEKAFPDLFYQELARLCGYEDWQKKPSFYGHITNKIYKMVDPDVADRIKELADQIGLCRHQFLTKDAGMQKLRDSINQAIGLARTCGSIQEFNLKMKLFEPGGNYQLILPFDKTLISKI